MYLNFGLRLGRESAMLYLKRDMDAQFKPFAEQVKARDKNTCQFCGFQSAKCMKVVNLDHNYRNNIMSNLATACPFCVQCMFLESVGTLMPGGGSLVYLPDISQARLNAAMHVLFAAIVNGSHLSSRADDMVKTLKLRTAEVEKHFGKGMSNPSFMGRVIIDTPDIEETAEQVMLKDIRLLPSLKHFEKDILSWAHQAQTF
ncbi:type IVB secretion system protein IcmJDotN [Gammaproteobacteria bacterium]|nr:type IVB secretion system protein IcmJDotN [Gammaproteobacteria bacterium]